MDVDDVKGRRKRERNDGMADGLNAMRVARRRAVEKKTVCTESFRFAVEGML